MKAFNFERGERFKTMDDSDKRVSKTYRKILTSNEAKAFMVYENLTEEMKQKVRKKMLLNGSKKAQHILNKLQHI